jgi:LmbE family N-acetylglucosaminyl deacetylase
MPETVLFLHAHPDDEAIFTAGTMRLLADRGHRVVLVVATRGEQGRASEAGREVLAAQREAETRAAAELLGVSEVEVLGYADSGLDGSHRPGAFARAGVADAAARLVAVARRVGASVLVGYDEGGIYGHPDHLQVHRVVRAAAAALGTTTSYEATVDREYLHFVETHLVEEAGAAVTVPLGPLDGAEAPYEPTLRSGREGLGLAGTGVGLPSVLVDTVVDVRPVLDVKRAAMLAHASQIPEGSSALRLDAAAFAEVYGYEWYRRHGPPGPIEGL